MIHAFASASLILAAGMQFASTSDPYAVVDSEPYAVIDPEWRADPELGPLFITLARPCETLGINWVENDAAHIHELAYDTLAARAGLSSEEIDPSDWQASIDSVGGHGTVTADYVDRVIEAVASGDLAQDAQQMLAHRFECFHVPNPGWFLENLKAPILHGSASGIERAEFQVFMTRIAEAYPDLPIAHETGNLLELSAAIELARWLEDQVESQLMDAIDDGVADEIDYRRTLVARTLAYVLQEIPYETEVIASLVRTSKDRDDQQDRMFVSGPVDFIMTMQLEEAYQSFLAHVVLSQSRFTEQPWELGPPFPPPAAPPPPPTPEFGGSILALMQVLTSERRGEFSFSASDFLNRLRLGAGESLEERLSAWNEVAYEARPPACNDPEPRDWRWGTNDRLPLRFVRECLTLETPDFVSDANAAITAMLGYATPSGWYFVPFCSATILDFKTVVTARHCFDFDDRCTAEASNRLIVFIPASGQHRTVKIASGEAALGGYCDRRVRDGDNAPDDILVLTVEGEDLANIPSVSIVEQPPALQPAQIGGWAATSLDPATEEVGDWWAHFRWPAGNRNACFVFMEGEGCVTHLCMTGEGFSGAALTEVSEDALGYAARLLGVHTGAEGYCRASDALLSETIGFINENGFEYLRYNEAVSGQALCRHLESVSEFRCS